MQNYTVENYISEFTNILNGLSQVDGFSTTHSLAGPTICCSWVWSETLVCIVLLTRTIIPGFGYTTAAGLPVTTYGIIEVHHVSKGLLSIANSDWRKV